MEMFAEFLDGLLKSSPVIGLLIIAIWYLYKEKNKLEDKLEAKNNELNSFIKDEYVKNTQTLTSVSATMDTLLEQTDENMDSLKEWLDMKLK